MYPETILLLATLHHRELLAEAARQRLAVGARQPRRRWRDGPAIRARLGLRLRSAAPTATRTSACAAC